MKRDTLPRRSHGWTWRVAQLAGVAVLLGFLAPDPVIGRDIFVHALAGQDAGDGTRAAPLATARKAIELARAGDVIQLLPERGVYREMITLADKRDITIEGNDCVVTAADPLPADPAKWEQVREGLHRIRLRRTLQDRHILVVNGSAVTMGRTKYQIMPLGGIQRSGGFEAFRKALMEQYPKPDDLKDGQFAWEPIDATHGWLYVRGPLVGLEWSVRPQGLYTEKEVHNVTLRRLHARHALNDGFNLHGNAQNIRLFNVSANECFDNGISPHGACSFKVEDGEFLRNEMAVGNDFLTETHFLRCTIGQSVQEEIVIIGGRHLFEDCHIRAGGPVAVRLLSSKPGPGRPAALREIEMSGKDPNIRPQYTFRRCTVESADGKSHAFIIQPDVTVVIENCTFRGIEFQTDEAASVTVSGSTLDGKPLTREILGKR